MKSREELPAPDFALQWRNDSGQALENFYCALPSEVQGGKNFMRAEAMLCTAHTHIIVAEVTWAESTTLEFTPSRPGFSSLVSTSSSLIEYGYGREALKLGQHGRVMFMLPGKVVRSQQSPGTTRSVTCSFDPEYAESILGPLEQLSPAQVSAALDVRSSLISALLLRLMHEALYPGLLQEAVVESFGQALLVECAHWLAMDASAADVSGKLTARHLSIVEDLLVPSGAAPTVAELAAACGFSERYFAKLFRETMKCSIGQYIKSMQIMKAKSYLLETDLPLKEIAYRLGFSTPANFSSAFRVATDSSPGQFRKSR